LEVTRAVGSSITSFNIVLDSGTSTTAYFSQPMLNFGTYLGSGNYVAIPQEWIPFETIIGSIWGDGTAKSAVSFTLYTQSDSSLAVPIMAKRIHGYLRLNDSGSSTSNTSVLSLNFTLPVSVCGLPNGSYGVAGGLVSLNTGATLPITLQASGVLTSYPVIVYVGVQL
jgi:hypothetical protein